MGKLDDARYKTHLWKETFAWLPVTTIGQKRIWLKSCFKRRVIVRPLNNVVTQYATVFEMMDDPYDVKFTPYEHI